MLPDRGEKHVASDLLWTVDIIFMFLCDFYDGNDVILSFRSSISSNVCL